MGFAAISDTGPLLHLAEINACPSLGIMSVCTTNQVQEELARYEHSCSVPTVAIAPGPSSAIAMAYELGMGESSCIAYAITSKVRVFFTDDLAARVVAKAKGLEPHGTIGIILRSYRNGILTYNHARRLLVTLPQNSTLFVTQHVLMQAVHALDADYQKEQEKK